MLGEKHFRPPLKAPWASSTQNPIRAKGAFPAQFRNGAHGSAALGARRPNGPVRPSRAGARLGEGRAPARPRFACSAPAIGCRPPAFIPYAHVLQPARLPFRARSPQRARLPQRTCPPQRKRPPLQARRRRPGTAPRTCSRTPPRAAAPPRDEIPLRNNPARPAAPSPPARPAGTSPPPAPDMSLRPAPEASSHSVPDASRRPDCGTGRRGGARSGAGGPSKTAEAGTGSAIPAAWRRRLASAL